MYPDFKAKLPQEWVQLDTNGDDTFRASDGKFPQTTSMQLLWNVEIKLMNM